MLRAERHLRALLAPANLSAIVWPEALPFTEIGSEKAEPIGLGLSALSQSQSRSKRAENKARNRLPFLVLEDL